MSDRDNDIEIFAMNADGSNQTRLTYAPGRVAHASWSPDGSKIYCEFRHSDAQNLSIIQAWALVVRALIAR